MKKALLKEGFSFIEVVTQCPSIFGRRIGMDEGTRMLRWFQEKSIPISKAKDMMEKELTERIVVGEFSNIEKPGLLRNMQTAKGRMTE